MNYNMNYQDKIEQYLQKEKQRKKRNCIQKRMNVTEKKDPVIMRVSKFPY